MTGVHLRKHEAVQDCGSYEVWFDDGRPSKFFYFDDLPNVGPQSRDHLSISFQVSVPIQSGGSSCPMAEGSSAAPVPPRHQPGSSDRSLTRAN